MSIALKFGDLNDPQSLSGFIYVDATTELNKNYKGKVTEHPIDAGASITDHYISSNTTYRLSGVISSFDLSPIPSMINIDGEVPLNINAQPNAVSVSDFGSGLKRLIPGSIAQFLPTNLAVVTVDGSGRKDYSGDITELIRQVMTGLTFNQERNRWENQMTPITMYEMDGNSITTSTENLILTDFQIMENVENGDALTFSATFEQVRFVTLEKVETPKAARNTSVGRGVEDKKNKGNVPSTPKDPASNVPSKPRISVMGQINKVFSN